MKLPVNYDDLSIWQRRTVREIYMQRQNGKCYHCGNYFESEPAPFVKKKKVNRCLFPEEFFNHPVHLHHSHDTGMTIGAVHSYCNAVLWQYHGE